MNHLDLISLNEVASLEKRISVELPERIKIAQAKSFYPQTLDRDKDYDGIRFSKRRQDLVLLVLVSWYSDYFQGFEGYVRYEIEQYLRKHCIFPAIAAALVDKSIAILMLYIAVGFNHRILGSILEPDNLRRVLNSVSLRYLRSIKPKYPIRRRGYKDKGSCVLPSLWKPKEDWSLVEEQNYIEWNRELYDSTITLLVREAGDWALKCGYFVEKLHSELGGT